MYEQAMETRGSIGPSQPTPAGVHSEVVGACERMGKLIAVHEELLRRLRGPQPESSAPGKQAREPQAISDFVQILHQQLSTLEQQSIQLGNALG